jgi:hypothetical protein
MQSIDARGRPQRSISSTMNKRLTNVLLARSLLAESSQHYRTTESSNVDDRTQHELYFAPFLRAVQADVAAVMCSYSASFISAALVRDESDLTDLINNTYACQNDKMLNQVRACRIVSLRSMLSMFCRYSRGRLGFLDVSPPAVQTARLTFIAHYCFRCDVGLVRKLQRHKCKLTAWSRDATMSGVASALGGLDMTMVCLILD